MQRVHNEKTTMELRRDSAALLNGHQATAPNLAVVVKYDDNKSGSSSNSKLENMILTNPPAKLVKDFNQFITCHLCQGYLIDATTIIECLHSYCRSCIVKHLDKGTTESRLCPKCNGQIHKTKPKQNIRSDPTLQDIVYKLVPKLYKSEMSWRKSFYSRHPDKVAGLSNEEKGEIHGERMIISPDDNIQLTIEYFPEVSSPFKLLPFKKDENQKLPATMNQRRYLLCIAGMRVLQLIKFIRYKYDLDAKIQVNFYYKSELLREDLTLMDLAYSYTSRTNMPIPLSYLIIEPNKDKSDYLCLLSNPKLSIPRSPRQQKRQKRVMKNVLEPCNFNAQMNNSKQSTHQVVLPNQRLLFEGTSNSLSTLTFSTSSNSVPNETMLGKGTAKKRIISDNGCKSSELQIIEEKRTKLLSKENLAQIDSKVNNSQTDNEMTFTEDDDSSTDVSETSLQIDLICKSDSVASCGQVAKSSSDTNNSTSSTATSSTTISIESVASTKNNHDTQIIKPLTSMKMLPTDPPITKNLDDKSNQKTESHISQNDVHIVNGPTETSKAEAKLAMLSKAVTSTVTVVSLAQSTVQDGSLETTVENGKPAVEMNIPTTKEQNNNSITAAVASSNTTFLLQSPKCDSIATSSLKNSYSDNRKDVVFAPLLVNKGTNGETQSAQAKSSSNGNTCPPLATNGRSKFCFSQLATRPDFLSKAFNLLSSNIGNTAQSSKNIDSTVPKNVPTSSINSTK